MARCGAAGEPLDQLAIAGAHRHLEDAGLLHVAADADELRADRTALALRLEPVEPAREDHRNEIKRLDVVDDGRQLPQSLLTRKRRLVARLGAFAFKGFEQRRLFTANVAAWTDEYFQLERQIRSKDTRAKQAFGVTPPDLRFENVLLLLVLVSDVKDALPRAHRQPAEDHALDEQVRRVRHDVTVFDGARLALVGVADDVLLRAWLIAHQLPLHAGRETGAAQTPQAAI